MADGKYPAISIQPYVLFAYLHIQNAHRRRRLVCGEGLEQFTYVVNSSWSGSPLPRELAGIYDDPTLTSCWRLARQTNCIATMRSTRGKCRAQNATSKHAPFGMQHTPPPIISAGFQPIWQLSWLFTSYFLSLTSTGDAKNSVGCLMKEMKLGGTQRGTCPCFSPTRGMQYRRTGWETRGHIGTVGENMGGKQDRAWDRGEAGRDKGLFQVLLT